MPDSLPNHEGRIGSVDRCIQRFVPFPMNACIAYESVVCLHPLVVIGAPTLMVICATLQAASQRTE